MHFQKQLTDLIDVMSVLDLHCCTARQGYNVQLSITAGQAWGLPHWPQPMNKHVPCKLDYSAGVVAPGLP